MSNTAVENEVVRMQFDNRQFEAGVKQSMSTLDKLKAALHLDKSAQGFKQIGDAAKKVNFNPITNGIEGVKKSFTYMDVAFATAVARMTNDAITAGKRIASALTIDPIKTGLSEYETKLNAVQVMKSNKGGTIEDITQALDELNRYADKTIYNFTQMTNNVGKFVAQGMTAKEASKAVEGMANLAGASGASAEDMARATYQMSQAMGGTIRKIDWNSLRNANMATMQLKDVLKAVAKTEYGTDVDALIKKAGTFEDTLEEGWLSGDLFKRAMEMYSDVYSEAELKQKGYTEAQIKMFKDLAKEAAEATTSVKTLSQLWDVIKETAQSGWTQSWEWIIGDLDEAKRIWTSLNNMISGYIDKVSTARNKLLEVWATGFKDGDKQQSQLVSPALLTGREEVLLGLSEFAHGITAIVQSIRAAFRDIFPPMTGRRLVELSYGFRKLMQAIKPTYKELENIFYAMRGFFSIIGLVRDIIAEVIKALIPAFSTARDLNEIILQAAGFIGNLVYAITKWLRESGTIHKVVSSIASVLGEVLKQLGRIIIQIFRIIHDTGLDRFLVQLIGYLGNGLVWAIEHILNLVTKVADVVEKAAPKIKAFFAGFANAIKNGKPIEYLINKFKELGKVSSEAGKNNFISKAFEKMGKYYSAVIAIISKAIKSTYEFAKSLDYSQGLALILSGIFGILLMNLTGLIKAMTILTKNWGGLATTISKTLKKLGSHNPIVLELAIFVGILSASLFTLSKIPVKKLWNGVGAIFALAVIMGTFGAVMTKVTAKISALPREVMLGMLATLLTMSITMVNLSKAVKTLSGINFWAAMGGVIELGLLMLEIAGISALIMKFAPKVSLSAVVMLLFCSTLALATKTLLKIDFSSLKNISKDMLMVAGILSASALMLGIGLEKVAFATSGIAKAILMISTALYIVSKINTKHHRRMIKDLKAVVLGVIGLVVAVGWAGYVMHANDKAIKEFTKGILRITESLLLMALVLKICETVKRYHRATRVMGDIVGYMALLIAGLSWLSEKLAVNSEGIKQMGHTLLLISVSMAIIATTITAISAISMIRGGTKVLKTAGIVLGVLTGCVAGLIAVSQFSSKISFAPILALMLGLSAIFTELVILAGMDPNKLETATKSMIGVVVALGVLIFALSKIAMKDAPAQVSILVSFVAIFLSFSAAMTQLCALNWDDMQDRMGAVMSTLVLLEGLVWLTVTIAHIMEANSKDFLIAAGSITALAAALLMISAAFAIVPDEIAGDGLLALAFGLGGLVATFAILGTNGAMWAAGITALAGSLATLGKSLWVIGGAIGIVIGSLALLAATFFLFSKINMTNGIVGLIGFIGIIVILTGLSGPIALCSAAMLEFSLALLAMSGAALIGGAGLLLIAASLKSLANVGADNLLDISVGLLAIAGASAALAIAGAAVLFAVPGLLGIAGGLALIGTVNLVEMSVGLSMFSSAIASLVPNFLTLISSAIGIDIFAKSIKDLEPALIQSAYAVTMLVDGMNQFIAIKDAFISASNQIGIGLKKGLVSGLNQAQISMRGCANNLISTFCSILGIHSPSRVFRDIGIYMMQGLAQGEKEGSDDAKQILVDNAKDAAQTMETTGCQLMGNAGRKMGETWVNDLADEMGKGKTNSKITTAAQNTGQNATNKTAQIITSTASIIANAAAQSGNAAGVAFVNAMAGVLNVAMPQMVNSVNGTISKSNLSPQEEAVAKGRSAAADAKRKSEGAKLEASTDWTTLTYEDAKTMILNGDTAMAEAINQHFGGIDSDAYKAWKAGTAKTAAQMNQEWKDNHYIASLVAGTANYLSKEYDKSWTKEAIDHWTGGDKMQDIASDYLGLDFNEIKFTGIEDYSSKVNTQISLTEKEKKMLQDMGKIEMRSISESHRATQVRRYGNMDYTEEQMKANGWEWNDKDKRWYQYYTIDEKGNKSVVTTAENNANAIDGLSDSMSNLKDTTKETESEMETFTKALNSNLKSAMNYFDEFKYGTEEDKISKEELLKNLEDQHNGMISWAKDMEELAHRGMAKDLWKNLAEEGPASYAKVKAFLDMTQKELNSANDWFARDLALPDVTTGFMSNILQQYFGESGELHDKMYENGKWFSKGLANGMAGDESKGEIADAASIVVKTANDTVKTDGGINSPSKVWAQYGVYFVEGLMVGMRDTMRACTKQISNMIKTINRTVRDGLRADIFKTIGRNAMQGLISGFVSQMDQLNRIVNNIADRIPHTITGKWVIKSPSRLFKSFGMYAMEGLALGLSQYSTLAEAAASETADNTAKTLNGITNSVLDWDTDFNPVITPTLNLDNVTRGVREINDMFKETTLDTVVEDPVQNGGTTPQPSTTFIQNNYSPKHLSSIDIYRQTRNQLSSLKGAMG